MKVFMFKPRFARLVEAGTKRQTVRPWRNIPVCAGDELSLREWTEKPYRSKQRILRTELCKRVDSITIALPGVLIAGRLQTPHELHAFAKADGFQDWGDLLTWFEATHGPGDFHGFVTHW